MNFETIYKTHWQKVFRLCMGYVNDTDRAKDLTQETFIKVWKHLPKFRNESSIGTWIFRIASNTCLRQIQKENKMPKSELPLEIKDEILDTNIEKHLQFISMYFRITRSRTHRHIIGTRRYESKRNS